MYAKQNNKQNITNESLNLKLLYLDCDTSTYFTATGLGMLNQHVADVAIT